MSSRLEPPAHAAGAPRRAARPSPQTSPPVPPRIAPRSCAPAAAHGPAQPAPHPSAPAAAAAPPAPSDRRPPARYEPYLDGLFTYCLSTLHDHAAATEVLGDVLAVADRRHGRGPAGEPGRTAWLYALARWICLRRLAERRRGRPGAHRITPAAPGEERAQGRAKERGDAEAAAPDPAQAARQRAELALLSWPEAAGATPEQRDALELAVRHGLAPRQVAAVLGLDPPAARELLAAGAREVERTRTALAVVDSGECPAVARLAGDGRVLLSAALRTELVRHVDDCPCCRRTAEHAHRGGPRPGVAVTPDVLPLVAADRVAVSLAMRHTPRARACTPRFGPTGFPLHPDGDAAHAARRERLRTRALTTTVVAAVVAAPVLALWAAYRGAQPTGDGRPGGSSVSAGENGEHTGGGLYAPYDRYENAGSAEGEPDARFTAGSRSPAASVETAAAPGRPGRLTVGTESAGGATRITLRASGGAPVRWSAWTDAAWLRLDRTSGVLRPGESVTLWARVDRAREPSGAWSARVGVEPSGTVVPVGGRGASSPATPTTPPASSTPSSPAPSPSEEPPSPTPSPSPSTESPPPA